MKTFSIGLDLPLPRSYGSTPEAAATAAAILLGKLRGAGFNIYLTEKSTPNPNYKILDFPTEATAQAAADVINSMITPAERLQITTEYTNPAAPFAIVRAVQSQP